ncbi:redoxin domain-containing protein [uncultured Lutibacter sp.]|uniref:redoxin domain-containing protein n=1 Tax=uncultured Lutibacter sp. TaxID=437739 RepID=UPI00262569F2|nr:redoxin domain-containing protein [uncultured Lutibacter sp.]
MKKIIYLLSIVLLIVSCKDEPKDYVTLSGSITDKNSDSLIVTSKTYHKKIDVNSDGTFSDTLKIETGIYKLNYGIRGITIYLENGYDLKMILDVKDRTKTITYTGVGAEVNNYLSEKAIIEKGIIRNLDILNLEKEGFDQKIKELDETYNTLLDKIKNADSTFVKNERLDVERQKRKIIRKFKEKQELDVVLKSGNVSPLFIDYENNNGKRTSLKDFKGKYVYISLWRARRFYSFKNELPHIQTLQKEFSNKNVAFVFISLDREKEYNTWKQVIIDNKLGGTQLYAKEDRSFTKAYGVIETPRFILIDPKGNIVEAEAPKPSSNELKVLFDKLKL